MQRHQSITGVAGTAAKHGVNTLPVTENEAGLFWERHILPFYRRRKGFAILLYLTSLFYLSIPSVQIPLLAWQRTRVSSLMEQRGLEHFGVFYPRQSWNSAEAIAPALFRSIISMEDGSFFMHRGVDWKELDAARRANNRRKKAARGGSTLTMQLAKNLYFTTNKSIIRKAKELLVTFRMEKELNKTDILETYVNVIEWGDGIFGIGAAAENYFDKSPAELNGSECARLAAVIPSPLKHAPNQNNRYVNRRSSIIKGRMNDVQLAPGNEKKRHTRPD